MNIRPYGDNFDKLMTLNECAVLLFATLIGGPLCEENHPLRRLKNPIVVYMITCRLLTCKTRARFTKLFMTELIHKT